MVNFIKKRLNNGLTVLLHEDRTTPMAVVNLLYDVGARDENETETGFAHLFEHLMFGGSVNIPVYDEPLQRVGGENNAFTSNDLTNYYIALPAVNIETAFWLESDRMLGLSFSEKSLEVQKNVVCEEFKQRYLNQPYGNVWLNLRPLAYKKHPYKWATIGKELSHIQNASIDMVKAFFQRYYNPSNAILTVAGNIDPESVFEQINQWFGSIPCTPKPERILAVEPPQTEARRLEMTGDVPLNAIYITFHIPQRLNEGYYCADVLSDILSRGNSSRLFKTLVKDKQLFSDINAYVTGSIDPGLFVVEGKVSEGVSVGDAEAAIWEEIYKLYSQPVTENELVKIKNKIESTMVFAEMNLLDKAINLSYFELLGDGSLLNKEADNYLKLTPEDLMTFAGTYLISTNSSTLIYLNNR